MHIFDNMEELSGSNVPYFTVKTHNVRKELRRLACQNLIMIQWHQWESYFPLQNSFQTMENTKRIDTPKKPVLQSGAGLVHTQLGELQRNVARMAIQNHKKYQRIILAKPFFEHQLYKVPDIQPWQKPFLRELLMRQLDQLIEEEGMLERELARIQLREEELQVRKEQLVASTVDPYQVMKSVWNSTGRRGDAVEHIESLNEIVGHIRHSVKRLTENEAHCSKEEQERYLDRYNEMRASQAACKECPLKEQSKKQLRGRVEELEAKLKLVEAKVTELNQELAEKDETIRGLSKRALTRQNQLQSKMLNLDQRLMGEEEQVRQLRRFKQEIDDCSFHNPQQGYQVALLSEADLQHLNRQISLPLEHLLDMLGQNHQQPSVEVIDIPPQPEPVSSIPPLQISNDNPLIPELSLGLELSSIGEKKQKSYKRASTDRPSTTTRTERKNRGLQFCQKIEEIQQLSKKYIRTNQLTTKRHSKGVVPMADLPGTASTIKMSDSPKNIEQIN